MGQDYSFAPRYIRGRDPISPTNASPDIKPKEQQGHYPTGSFWTNTTNQNLWALQKITNNLANWILLGSGGVGPLLKIAVPLGTTPIVPDTTGQVTFTSNAGTIDITGSTAGNPNFINFDIHGGLLAVERFQTDDGLFELPSGTPPTIVVHGTGSVTTSQGAGNQININSVGLNKWLVINQGTQPANLAINTGYICQAGGTGNVSIALPAASILGDMIEIVLDGATTWTLTQAAGQSIRASGAVTTVGVGGSIATTGTGDSLRLVCETANTRWVAVGGFNGNLTVT